MFYTMLFALSKLHTAYHFIRAYLKGSLRTRRQIIYEASLCYFNSDIPELTCTAVFVAAFIEAKGEAEVVGQATNNG